MSEHFREDLKVLFQGHLAEHGEVYDLTYGPDIQNLSGHLADLAGLLIAHRGELVLSASDAKRDISSSDINRQSAARWTEPE